MADIETRKTIGKNARKSIKKFTGQEVIGKWLKILEKKWYYEKGVIHIINWRSLIRDDAVKKDV